MEGPPPTKRRKTDTELHDAVLSRNLELIRELVKTGADPNKLNEEGKTAVWYLGSAEDAEYAEDGVGSFCDILDCLVPKAGPAAKADMADILPIVLTSGEQQAAIKLIQDAGVDPVAMTDQCTALHAAAENSLYTVAEFLTKNFKDSLVNKVTSTGATALALAVMKKDQKMCELLLNNGADPNLRGAAHTQPNTTVHTPTPSQHTTHTSAQSIASHDSTSTHNAHLTALTAPQYQGFYPLHIAITNGDAPLCHLLLKHGAVICSGSSTPSTSSVDTICTLTPPTGTPPPPPLKSTLHFACIVGYTDVLKVLLENGGKEFVNSKNWVDEFTPVHLAVVHDWTDVIGLLLVAGAKLEEACANGTTPLYLACELGRTQCAAFLIQKGANTSFSTENGCTLMHAVAMSGSVPILDILLEKDRELLDKQNKAGTTPLHIAIKKNQKDLVKQLLAHGADPHQLNSQGATPLQLCVVQGAMGNFQLAQTFMESCSQENAPVQLDVMKRSKSGENAFTTAMLLKQKLEEEEEELGEGFGQSILPLLKRHPSFDAAQLEGV